jgi:AraC family transcriptional activator of pobA
MSDSPLNRFQARSEAFLPGLRPLTLRPNRAGHASYHHLILIEKGHALLSGEGDVALGAHTAMVLPPDPARLLTVQAGSRGWLLGCAPDLFFDAIGAKTDSLHLRAAVSRLGLVTCDPAEFQAAFATPVLAFHAEVTSGGRGAAIAALAHLRLVLIAFWRHSAQDTGILRGKSSESRIVEDFRRLVELGFRQQRPVAAYAADLGLTYDRLHDICRRSLGRTPLQLIHQRILREAGLRLEKSGETIEQIALGLGFADPTRFSHFFRRHAGLPPRDFRRKADRASPQIDASSFADWP